jgi:hypothetical protein
LDFRLTDFTVLNDRASELLTRLDTRYSEFSDQLPCSLRKLARQKGTFLVSQGEGSFDRVSDLKPVLAGAPWLFWDVFDDLDDDVFFHVAEAGAFYVLASLVLDNLIDQQVRCSEVAFLLYQALLQKGITQFQRLFASNSPFWDHFERLSELHLEGLILELRLRSGKESFTEKAFVEIAKAKGSTVVTTIAALTQLSDQIDIFRSLESSINHGVAAALFGDDLRDWKEDLKAKRLTYFLSSLAPPSTWHSTSWPSVVETRILIAAKWANVRHLQSMVDRLDHALKDVDGIDCPGWKEYLSYYRELATGQLHISFANQIIQGLGDLVEEE